MSAPYAPFNVVLVPGYSQIYLSWDPVVGATSYSVQRSTDGINWTSTFASPTNSFLDTSVTVGQLYYYQVASVNLSTTGGYVFTVTSANATGGATYINNGQSFQVLNTIAAGLSLQTSSTGTPAVSGTLTKISGSGDLTITFSAAVSTGGTSSYTACYPAYGVACLPGQINLSYLIYQSQLRADKLNSEYLTLDEWTYNINTAAFELYDILVSKFGDNYFLAPPLQFNLTGLQSYLLPNGAANYSPNAGNQTFTNTPACYKLSGIDVNLNNPSTLGPNQGWVPVPRANWSDRDRWSMWPGVPAGLNNAFMLSYRPMGNQLFFFPANLNQTVQLWYVPMLTKMVRPVDMLPYSISMWEEYVIVRAAMLAMSKEESNEKYSVLQGQLATQIERIETQAANRDVDAPNTVSNTRGTSDDPGFGFGNGGFGGFGQGFGG